MTESEFEFKRSSAGVQLVQEVKVHDLTLYADARGWVQPMAYEGLGHVAYVYATVCYPGVVKAWHRHREHTDRLMCVSGLARVVVARKVGGWTSTIESVEFVGGSPEQWDFQEFIVGPLSPKVVVIPPGWQHGFTPVGSEPCVVVNAPDMPYDPDDEERLELSAIPFDWEDIDG